MSSDDLKSILCEDLNSAESDKLSPDEIKLIVGVLKMREENKICEIIDTNIQNEKTKQTEVTKAGSNISFLHKQHFLRITAAIICALLVGIVTVFACKIDLVSIFKSWTDELFQIDYSSDIESNVSDSDISIDKTELTQCNSASEVLSILGITQPLLPSWIPANYSLSECQIDVYSDRITMYEYYEALDLNSEFSIQITIYSQLPNEESSWYQKDDTTVELFCSGGIEHHIMSNLEDYIAVWTIDNYECSIGGSISVDTLKNMISSIYH